MKAIAVILCGGSGERFSDEKPKQFIEIADKEVWAHTTSAFEASDNIREVIIASHRDYIEHIRYKCRGYGFTKVTNIVEGGKERHLSAYNAITACVENSNEDKVIIIDGVRPLISDDVIARCINILEVYDVADTGIPATETLFLVRNNEIKEIPNRSLYYYGQGPECFRLGILRESLEKVLKTHDYIPTNLSGIVKKFSPEIKIGFVKGDINNIKLTYKSNLLMIEHMLTEK